MILNNYLVCSFVFCFVSYFMECRAGQNITPIYQLTLHLRFNSKDKVTEFNAKYNKYSQAKEKRIEKFDEKKSKYSIKIWGERSLISEERFHPAITKCSGFYPNENCSYFDLSLLEEPKKIQIFHKKKLLFEGVPSVETSWINGNERKEKVPFSIWVNIEMLKSNRVLQFDGTLWEKGGIGGYNNYENPLSDYKVRIFAKKELIREIFVEPGSDPTVGLKRSNGLDRTPASNEKTFHILFTAALSKKPTKMQFLYKKIVLKETNTFRFEPN